MKRQGRQRGAVLVVTLVMLVMALMLGLSSFQSARLEESMAGNQRASILAFRSAEFGASSSRDDLAALISSGVAISSCPTSELWLDAVSYAGFSDFYSDFAKYSHIDWRESGGDGQAVSKHAVAFCKGVALYRAVSLGGVFSDNGSSSPLVHRAVSVTLDVPSGPNLTPPWLLLAKLGNVSPPGGNLSVEGGYDQVLGMFVPAVIAADEEDADKLKEGVKEVDDVYIGGISTDMPSMDLVNPASFVELVNYLREQSQLSGNNYYSDGFSASGNQKDVDFGAADPNGKITFVDGDYSNPQGNTTGSGVLVVNGDMTVKGTPGFEGLIIVLGNFHSSGGGQTDNQGTIMVAPLLKDEGGGFLGGEDAAFGIADFTFSGGGGASYKYSSEGMEKAFGLIDDELMLEKFEVDLPSGHAGDIDIIAWNEML